MEDDCDIEAAAPDAVDEVNDSKPAFAFVVEDLVDIRVVFQNAAIDRRRYKRDERVGKRLLDGPECRYGKQHIPHLVVLPDH